MRLLPSKKTGVLALVGILLGVFVYKFALSAGSANGFDLSNSSLPPEQILRGGPPRDGIPALSNPKLIAGGDADYLKPADRIIGITLKGQSRAYPIGILNWHEIVNDTIDGQPFAVTYCPLLPSMQPSTVLPPSLAYQDYCITAMFCCMTVKPSRFGHKF